MSVMVTLTKQQVPAYLVGSDFYNSLSGDNDEEFSIPKQYFKPTTSVSSAEELSHFMKTINFWGLKKLSDEIIELLVFKTTEFPETERTKICKVLLELDVEFDLLELYLNVPVSISRKQRFDASVQCGNEHVLEYVYTVDNQVNPTLVKAVALNGHVRLLQQIVHEQGNAPYYYASIPLCTIAGRVRLDCLRYLLDTGFLVDQKTGLATIKSGHLECLKLVHERGNAFDDKNAVETAAMNGHLECLMYILQNGGVATVSTASAAAAGGHVDCLQYILDQGVPLSTPMCNSAASGGSVECLKLLHARGCPWGKLCLKIAASRGNLACLKYLISQGATADASAAYAAVVNGKHFCLEFLLEKGCVVDKESVIEAVRRNRMHCLHILSRFEVPLDEAFALYFIKIVPNLTYIRLLVRAGYALPDLAVNGAIEHYNLPCLELICANNSCELTTNHAALAASTQNRVQILELLHQYNCPWDVHTCINAAAAEIDEALAFAHTHGCPWDERVCSKAIQTGRLSCLMYACENGCPCSEHACVEAARHGRCTMLQFLHEQGHALTLEGCGYFQSHRLHAVRCHASLRRRLGPYLACSCYTSTSVPGTSE